MISPTSTSKHYQLSSGKLTVKLNESHTPPPKIIHYEHKVRVISPFQCDHETSIDTLSKKHELEIQQKNNQINKLKMIVQEKEALLIDKENLIIKLQEREKKQSAFEVKTQKAANLTQKSYITTSFIWNSVTENKIQQILPDKKYQEINTSKQKNEQILKVEEQMKNTISALNNITNTLQKPRKKYKFYFENFQTQQNKKIEEIPCQKRLGETTINPIYNDSLNETFIQSIENDQNYQDQSDFVDLDPDQTLADDNSQTQSFLESVIKQHKMLRQNLVELEESTNKQIKQMKEYYEKEIRMYIQLLNSSNKVPSKFTMDTERTNFSSEQNIFDTSQLNWRQSEIIEIQNNEIIDERQYPPDC